MTKNPVRTSRQTTVASHKERPANGVAGAQSIHRAFALLRAVSARGRQGARLVDIARQCELDRSTAHRMLKSLTAERMVTHDPDTRRYLLGHLAFELGLVAVPDFNMRQMCEPVLLHLAQRTGDTVCLSVRSGLDSVCMDRKEGSFPIKALTLEVGVRRPLGVGASGLALLMPLADEEALGIIATNAWRIAEYGNLRTPAVLDMLKRARARGYAVNDQHATPEAISVGVYIATPNGPPYGAISIAAIASRMSSERLQDLAALMKNEIQPLERALLVGNRPVSTV